MAYQQNYPKGAYVLKIVGQCLGESSQKGTPFVALKCEVLRAKKPSANEKAIIYDGIRTVNIWLTDKNKDKALAFLKAAGFNGHSLSQLDPESDDFISLEGFEFDASCEHSVSPTTGKKYDEFSSYPVKSAWGANISKTNTGKLMMLDALFGCNNVPAPKKVPTAATLPKAAVPDVIKSDAFDDDIPF